MMTRSIDQIAAVLRDSTLPLTTAEILARLQKRDMYQNTPRKSALTDISANLRKLLKDRKVRVTMRGDGINEWSDLDAAPDFQPAKAVKPKPLKPAPQDRPITVMFSLQPKQAEVWADALNDLTYLLAPTIGGMCKEIESHIRAGIKTPEVTQ